MTAQKFRIIFPTGSFYPAQTGGPDNTVYWITKALTQREHKPVIVTTDQGQPETTALNKWLDTNYGRVIYTKNYLHYYLPYKAVVIAMKQLQNADILHLTLISYPASWLLALYNSLRYKKPVIWSAHGELDPPMLLRSPIKKRMVLWLINKFVDKESLFFHATCDAESVYIRDNFGVKSKVIQIPNYMELPEQIKTEKQQYLLFIGRIDKKKGLDNLIKALKLSQAFLRSDFVLKIVGDYDNPYGSYLVELVASEGLTKKVEFVGHREGRAKEILLATAWFLIMPSHTENFGIVVTEALAQGTPAVASTGTPWAILPEKKAGYWVDNDPMTLAKTIDIVVGTDPEELKQMSANGLKLVSEHFEIHARAGEWEAAYQKAFQNK